MWGGGWVQSQIQSQRQSRGHRKWLTVVVICTIMDPPLPEYTMSISEAIYSGFFVAIIMGDHKDTKTSIGYMRNVIFEQYSGVVTVTGLYAMDS